jgi:N-methylhydantoinase A/oxoprolinase/acetone carboxylase beta subunit
VLLDRWPKFDPISNVCKMAKTESGGYLIGIDTGGTYTDAAVIDQAKHSILASAKALTTKGDLSIGVNEAMAKVLSQISPRDIHLVSVSTTLATNAVVEGHGSAVAVVLIGFDSGMIEKTGIAKAFPGIPIVSIAGGHDHNGEERAALDVATLRSFVKSAAKEVSAFAIASSFAVRNAAHEKNARDVIAELSSLPCTMSSELSSALDAPRRALTAVLNARLISRVTQLIDAVARAMAMHGISCPLMIVKGDGSLAKAESVAARPIETVLSGPAASLVGAKWLSGLADFIMSDMGGTTTDIGILANGRPRVAEQGAEVGGWRTMVKAIDVKTIGLGGDSEVQVAFDGSLSIGPQRSVPVSLIGQLYPEVITMLEADLADNMGGSLHGRFVLLPFGANGAAEKAGLNPREIEILAAITERPVPLRKIAQSSGAQRAIASLRKKGLIQYSAFTPSDASHVLGLQDNWSKSAAVLAAKLMARFSDMKAPSDERVRSYCKNVWEETVALTGRVILDAAFGTPTNGGALLDPVVRGAAQIGLIKLAASPVVPIVAVGGPVKVYYNEVGRRLNCEVVFAPHCEVANAVGAAAGMVAHRVTVTVEGDGNGAFRLLGEGGVEVFGSGIEALTRAIERAVQAAMTLAAASGAKDPRVTHDVVKHHLPNAANDDGLLSAVIVAEAVGRP